MKNEKIYLISPPTDEKRKTYPFSLMYLHSYLKKSGFASEVIDCNALKWSLRDLLRYLDTVKAGIVGVTGYTYNRFYAYDAIRGIRSHLPECKVIVGGHHFSSLANETIESLKEVDFVVREEGEIALAELCGALLNNRSVDNIMGITYRRDGKIISNPQRPLEMDLDKLHYDLNDFTHMKGNYSFLSTMRRFPANQGFMILTGRGCPARCVFCSLSSKRVRFRKVENVLDEIERMIKITGVRNLTFADPTLTASQRHLVALCEGILRRNLNVKWRCYSRADVKPEIFELMKKAGCVAADLAIESASPRVLHAIKKDIEVDEMKRCVKKLKSLGIKSFVYAMISLPDEKEQDAERTVRFLEEIADDIGGSTLAVTQIFPDAELYSIAKRRHLMPPDFDWFSDYYNDYFDKSNLRSNVPFYLEHLSIDFIKRMRQRFEKLYTEKYYDRHIFMLEFKKGLIPFLFDWKRQTVRSKARRIRKGLTRLRYAVKTKERARR